MNNFENIDREYFENVIIPYRNSDKIIDMHCHSTYSDGELTPMELIRHAIDMRIGTLSITDHCTIEGIKSIDRNDKLIALSGIKLINGVELSAKVDVGEMHILGYYFDVNNKKLNDKLSEYRRNSVYAVLLVLETIKVKYGIMFNSEDIIEMLKKNSVGRPDIAKLCVKYGYASSVNDAFSKYLVDSYNSVKCYVTKPSYEECINLINESGGYAVLAHPRTLKLEEDELRKLIVKMKDIGLTGIECYHSSHSLDETVEYLKISEDYDLLVSGGSDFHGYNVKPDIELGSGKNNNLLIRKLSICK